eukprot:RCo014897
MTKSGNHQHTHISAMPKYPKRKAQMKTFKWEQEGNQCRLRRGVRTLAPFDVTEKQQTHTDTEEISVRTLCTRTCRTLGMTFPVKKEKKMSVRKNPPPPQHPWLSHSQVLKERIENTKKTHRPLSTHGFPVTRIREKPPFPQYSSHPASSYKGKEERIQKNPPPLQYSSQTRFQVQRESRDNTKKKPPLPQYSSNLRFQVKLAHAERKPNFYAPPHPNISSRSGAVQGDVQADAPDNPVVRRGERVTGGLGSDKLHHSGVAGGPIAAGACRGPDVNAGDPAKAGKQLVQEQLVHPRRKESHQQRSPILGARCLTHLGGRISHVSSAWQGKHSARRRVGPRSSPARGTPLVGIDSGWGAVGLPRYGSRAAVLFWDRALFHGFRRLFGWGLQLNGLLHPQKSLAVG